MFLLVCRIEIHINILICLDDMEKKVTFIILAALVLVVSGCGGGSKVKSCSDDACFVEAAKTCSAASYPKVLTDGTVNYAIQGAQGDNCNVAITIEKATGSTPKDFEGKSMTCSIPKNAISTGFVSGNLASLDLDACSGPLKDGINALLQQILQDFGQALGPS